MLHGDLKDELKRRRESKGTLKATKVCAGSRELSDCSRSAWVIFCPRGRSTPRCLRIRASSVGVGRGRSAW